jgi:hypothetical protein
MTWNAHGSKQVRANFRFYPDSFLEELIKFTKNLSQDNRSPARDHLILMAHWIANYCSRMQYVTWAYKWHYNIYILYVHKNSNSDNSKSFITSIFIDDVHSTLVKKSCLLNEQNESYSPKIFSGVSVICYVWEIQTLTVTKHVKSPPRLQSHRFPSCKQNDRIYSDLQNRDHGCFRGSVDSSWTERYIIKYEAPGELWDVLMGSQVNFLFFLWRIRRRYIIQKLWDIPWSLYQCSELGKVPVLRPGCGFYSYQNHNSAFGVHWM